MLILFDACIIKAMFEKFLEEIGLSDKEAAVYVALLQTEHDSVANIAEKAKIKRTTVYPTLESLAQKGLVSEVALDKKTHYKAEPPERLETYIGRRKIELDENSRRLKDIIPQLKSIQREGGERPVVTFFEGKEGVMNSFEDFYGNLGKGGEVHLVYPRDLIDENFTKEEKARYRAMRLKNKVKSKSIYTYKKGDLDSDKTGDRIKIDAEKYPLLADISIYDDKVRINTLTGKLAGVSITNSDIATTLKSLLDLIFDKHNNKHNKQ